MAKWHRSKARGDWNGTRIGDGSSSFRRLCRVVVPMILLVAPLASCSGKKRDFAPESGVIADTSSDIPVSDPAAAGSANGAAPMPSDPTNAPGMEANGASEAPLDTATVAGTGLCDADAGCTCNDQVQSCDPLPLCDGGVDCPSAESCTGCLIEGDCVAAASPNPGNFCQVCAPDQNADGWTDADGSTCDDGAFCTVDDACRAGECVGSPRQCDDDVDCNGISTCDENADSCTPGQSQCGANSSCDATTGRCVSTCSGCVVSGTCHATGAEEPGNPCRVCDPSRSTSAFVAATGKSCGAPAGVCSGQDTCNAQGQCQPNHLADGTACGNPASSACDGPDTCDGRGNCLPRIAANSTPCNDGRFCSVGDACQGGVCSPTGNRNCGDGLACNENDDQCQCQGCVVGGNCFAAGALNGNNRCQICDPARSTSSFSGNTGARCGSGATECSAQDTCNAQGQCIANDLPFPTPCSSVPGGQCQGDGRCAAPQPTQARLTIVANGTGTVTSASGINCGTACSVLVNVGTQVTLQANTNNGSNSFFSGWSASECAGPARSCTVTMSTARTVTATFSPMVNNLIFASSEAFPSSLGGVAAYDAQCNRLASAAGINSSQGSGYIAFMSDDLSAVQDRIPSGVQGWIRLDGRPFTTTLSALFDDHVVLNSVLFDERGNQTTNTADEVLTGINSDGSVTSNCANWTAGATGNAQTGSRFGGPGSWSSWTAQNCGDGTQPIFCAGILSSAAVVPTRNAGKLIWVTTPVFNPGAAADPDALCSTSRPGNARGGVALIGRVNRRPSEVLDPSAVYVRPDGQRVGLGTLLLARQNNLTGIESGIWQAGDGTYQSPGDALGIVLTGAARLDMTSTVAQSCNDWKDAAGTRNNGVFNVTHGQWWLRSSDGACSNTTGGFRIYCVEP